jgi:hypothetical protein
MDVSRHRHSPSIALTEEDPNGRKTSYQGKITLQNQEILGRIMATHRRG